MSVVNTTTVTPVIDYEPRIAREGDAPSTPAPARRPSAGAGRPHAVHPRPVTSQQHRSAAAFADAALRTVLEVIDRRRPVTQLRPLMAAGLADSVVAFTRARPARHAAAVLHRTRLQACDLGERAYEVAAVYRRESRAHAIACRIDHVATPQGPRWHIVALHIG